MCACFTWTDCVKIVHMVQYQFSIKFDYASSRSVFFLLFTGRRQQQHQPPPTPTIYSFGVRVFVYFTSPSHPLPLFSHTRNMGCPFLSLLFASLTVSLSSCNHSSSLPLLILASPIFHSFVLPIFVVNPSKIVLYCICGIVNVFLWPPEYASGKG